MVSSNLDWMEYAVFYAYADEEDYDGVHNGGLKGMKDDAPEWAKKMYDEFAKKVLRGIR